MWKLNFNARVASSYLKSFSIEFTVWFFFKKFKDVKDMDA